MKKIYYLIRSCLNGNIEGLFETKRLAENWIKRQEGSWKYTWIELKLIQSRKRNGTKS